MLFFNGINLIPGKEIVAGDDIYGGSDRLLSKVVPKTGIVVKLISPISYFLMNLD